MALDVVSISSLVCRRLSVKRVAGGLLVRRRGDASRPLSDPAVYKTPSARLAHAGVRAGRLFNTCLLSTIRHDNRPSISLLALSLVVERITAQKGASHRCCCCCCCCIWGCGHF